MNVESQQSSPALRDDEMIAQRFLRWVGCSIETEPLRGRHMGMSTKPNRREVS
jgi:hypothetical protein